MAIDMDKAIKHAIENAQPASEGKCARYVREALEAGGADLRMHPVSAKDYGRTLLGLAFKECFYWTGSVGLPVDGLQCQIVNQCYEYVPVKDDIIVIQPYTEDQPHGHIAIYTGTQWVSDFIQRDMWAGPGFRKARPVFMIYRL